MEALQACEKALAEASCPTTRGATQARTASPPGVFHGAEHPGGFPEIVITHGAPGGSSLAAAAAAAALAAGEEEEAAILPLGEALPLLRRAVRLAVPPLRWRKRPPPKLREAALKVMSLDLSWRRAGKRERGGGGEGAGADDGDGDGEGGGDESNEDDGKGGGSVVEVGGSAGGAVAPGTSLEQAVLDALLAELGPGWRGFHSENRWGERAPRGGSSSRCASRGA